MPKFDSSVGKNLANEQPTVTVVWVSLAADQGDAIATRTLDETLDGSRKRLLFGHRSVQGVALSVIVILTCGPPPELLAQEQITHPALSHRGLELIAVEVRRVARVRKRAHIDQELDLLPRDELCKIIELMVRVAYCPDSKTRRHDSRHGRDRR
jgi:hypothetical protein